LLRLPKLIGETVRLRFRRLLEEAPTRPCFRTAAAADEKVRDCWRNIPEKAMERLPSVGERNPLIYRACFSPSLGTTI
jgi:hypothetical protein